MFEEMFFEPRKTLQLNGKILRIKLIIGRRGEELSDPQWTNIISVKPTMFLVAWWDHGPTEVQLCLEKPSRAVESVRAVISIGRV